jgi:hypothetical protein
MEGAPKVAILIALFWTINDSLKITSLQHTMQKKKNVCFSNFALSLTEKKQK